VKRLNQAETAGWSPLSVRVAKVGVAGSSPVSEDVRAVEVTEAREEEPSDAGADPAQREADAEPDSRAETRLRPV
jgi:hypothetical protein